MHIRIIHTETAEYNQMIALRLQVLLGPIGIPVSYISPQKEKEDTLLAAFEDTKLIGCCILTQVSPATVQLRQMAVDPQYQKNGVGAALLQFAEGKALEKGYRVLMMHARDAVLEFYSRHGYRTSSQQFFEVGIPHHKMEKELMPATGKL